MLIQSKPHPSAKYNTDKLNTALRPAWVVAALITVSGCVSLPDVYIIDHHTVMEEEASGEWPQLEQRFHDLAVTPGPVNLAKEQNDHRRKRSFSVLNGEMTTNTDNPASSL